MIRVGIVGISGYSGLETLKLLLKHPHVRVMYVSANNTTGPVTEIWPELAGKTKLFCEKYNAKKAIDLCDVLFLAVPHTAAMEITPKLIEAGKRIIDISADYRLKTIREYKKWYGVDHKDSKNLSKAVYGLPELYREKIKKAKLVANPGCYPTAALLALVPITYLYHELVDSIIIDAKSGTSGAGRKASKALLFSEVTESIRAYKVLNHQHLPEINSYLAHIAKKNFDITFVPHLLPINRGILETIYVRLNKKLSVNKVYSIYKKFYKTEKFVRILKPGLQPEVKNVSKTNYCDIGFAVNKNMLVITSAIDNLLKGAAGQAVQNMNIMFNFKENEAIL